MAMPEELPPSAPAPPSGDTSVEMLRALDAKITRGFRDAHQDYQLLSGEVRVLAERTDAVERRQEIAERRAQRNSDRAKDLAQTTSDHDLEHDSRIAAGIIRQKKLEDDVSALREETASQTEILRQLVGLSKNPVVKHIATAAGAAILSWLAAKGLR